MKYRNVISQVLLVASFAFLGVSTAYSACNVDLPPQFNLKEAKLKIFEYFGTYEAEFDFPNFLEFNCTISFPDSSNQDWKIVSWQLPESSPIRVIYRERETQRTTQEDAMTKFSISFEKNKRATYTIERAKVQTFFGGIKFLLSSEKPPSYQLLRGAQVDLALGSLDIVTQ